MSTVCTRCNDQFEVSTEDREFLDQMAVKFQGAIFDIPSPSKCPNCRMQQRGAWRNEKHLYSDRCDLTGVSIVSAFSSKRKNPVYSQAAFWSDGWNPLDYGIEYDFARPFFEQFAEQVVRIPQVALINVKTQNSEYCHRIYDGRNNYLCWIALYAPENLMYSYYTMACKSCVDVSVLQYSELCYNVTEGTQCYHCFHSRRIRNCVDCFFLEDCIGCKNCFGCKNLHQKQYCIFNEQKTKEEYEAFIAQANLGSHASVKKYAAQAKDFAMTLPSRAVMFVNVENSVGSELHNCKNCHNVFDFYESENVRHSSEGERSHNCMDCFGMGENEFCLECITLMYSQKNRFCATTIECSDLLYCYECYNNCKNCFGSVSLKKNEYCILNKQYAQDQYNQLMPKIIEHMKSTGEWGQFFPMKDSPFAFNETIGHEHYPMTKEQCQQRGLKWLEPEDNIGKVTKSIPATQLPDSIDDIPDDILNWAIVCENTGRPFRIIKQELEFYRNNNIPVPRMHHFERYDSRKNKRQPLKLFDDTCDKCSKQIQSTYSKDTNDIVYCEECYLQEMY